jgi:hypothetical protein
MQPSFHEYHETKISEFEVLRILNNQPRYDEYQDDEEHATWKYGIHLDAQVNTSKWVRHVAYPCHISTIKKNQRAMCPR